MRGQELTAAIGNVVSISAFDDNPNAIGASANDHYGVNSVDVAAEISAPTHNGPSGMA